MKTLKTFCMHVTVNLSISVLFKMKPMKSKSKPKGKIVAAKPFSSVKIFFKTAPTGSNCVEAKEAKAFDCKDVYVRALKDKLKNYDGETVEENVTKNCNTTQNHNASAVVAESGSNDHNNHKGNNGALESNDDRNNQEGAEPVTNDDDRNDDVVVSDGKKTNRLCDDASCELLRQKYKDLKATHFKVCQRHSELSVKYDELVKTLDEMKLAKSSSAAVSDTLSSTDDVFTPNEIIVLESLPLEKKKDSTFIHHCIQYAYKNNASTLVNKTLRGTLEKTEFRDDGTVVVQPSKNPLTPEKVMRIEKLFVSRVTKSKCQAGEFAERIKPANINRLIASAVRNVSNKEKPKKKQSQKNVNLDL